MQTKLSLTKPRPRHIPFIILGVSLVVLSVGFVVTLLSKHAYSATGNLYLTSSSSVQQGGDMQVVVRITPGTKIDTVTASVSYDTEALKYAKADYADSPFSTQIPAVVKDGTVTVQSAKLGGQTVSDDARIATLHFTAQKTNPSTPKLIYGNAAHAGIATNPTIDSKEADPAANPLAAPTTDGTNGNQPNSSSAASGVLAPLTALLKKAGVATQTAAKAAPWLAGILLTLLLAGVLLLGFWLWEKYGKHSKQTPQEQEGTV